MSRKSNKATGLLLNLPLAMKTGRCTVGFNTTLNAIVNKTARYVIITKNYPLVKRKQIEYYCVLAGNIPIKIYDGSNVEMANLIEKNHRSGVIAVLNQGEANLAV